MLHTKVKAWQRRRDASCATLLIPETDYENIRIFNIQYQCATLRGSSVMVELVLMDHYFYLYVLEETYLCLI